MIKKKQKSAIMWFADTISNIKSTTPLARTLPPTFHLQNKGGCQTRHISVEVQKMRQPNIYLRNQVLRYQRSRIIFGRVSPKITPPKIHKNQPSISRLETKLPKQKKGAMSWMGHLQLFPVFQDLRPPQKDMWGKGRFWVKS